MNISPQYMTMECDNISPAAYNNSDMAMGSTPRHLDVHFDWLHNDGSTNDECGQSIDESSGLREGLESSTEGTDDGSTRGFGYAVDLAENEVQTSIDVGIEDVDARPSLVLSHTIGEGEANQPVWCVEPCVGMVFNSSEATYQFYNSYAKEVGFSTRKSRLERSRVTHHIVSRASVCSKEGKKLVNDKRRQGKDYKPRPGTKTNCSAMMRVKDICGKLLVDRWVKEHNHDLIPPMDSFRLRSHQKMAPSKADLIRRLHSCGLTQTQVKTVLANFAGGAQYVGVSGDGCRNFMRQKCKRSLGIDCQLAINHFDRLWFEDSGFFYAIRLDNDHRLSAIFWIDRRAREQYKLFGDVLVFDTTYRKNKYKFPFAPFTGINHHMQSILLGAGLISDETVESFKWLFLTWLHAMGDVHPKAIFTDEDPAILRAIRHVFPSTIHQLCEWHLEKHRKKHMRPLYRKYPGLRSSYLTYISESKDLKYFEVRWEAMIRTFKLESNRWLKRQFRRRKLWVPCHFHDSFLVGMSASQRAESLNNYFKHFFTPSTPVNEFITKYEDSVKKRRETEAEADLECMIKTRNYSTSHLVEDHAANLYTPAVFSIFTIEWKACFCLKVIQCDEDVEFMRYKVFKIDGIAETDVQTVCDDEIGQISKCTCKMFEQRGVLCRHILKLYVLRDRTTIPEKYILKRWTKDARYIDSITNAVANSSRETMQLPLWKLHDLGNRLATEGSLSVLKYERALKILSDGIKEVSEIPSTHANQGTPVIGSQTHSMQDVPRNQTQCGDPYVNESTRARPSAARSRAVEENFRSRRPYYCSNCHGTGHNAASCTLNNISIVDVSTQPLPQSHAFDLNDMPTTEPDLMNT